MVAFDGEAAPVNVIAPAPDAPPSTLPFTFEPSLIVAVLPARMFPFQLVPDPVVKSRPTTNQTVLAWAPLTRSIRLGCRVVPGCVKQLTPVMMKTALPAFWASSLATSPIVRPRRDV